jgi:predicted flap endonuclease-1-like 5' DNA nuclease
MFWLIWQMTLFLLIAFLGGVFAGWRVWSSSGRSAEADEALTEVAKLRRENENLARRLGEAETKTAEAARLVMSQDAIAKTGAAALPDAISDEAPITPAKTPSKVATKTAKTRADKSAKVKPPAPANDDLSAIKGIGPKAKATLIAGGITRYAQIASWTEQDIAQWDMTINGRGRIVRDDWVGQAKKLG